MRKCCNYTLRLTVLLLILVSVGENLCSQTLSLPYFCGFETAEETAGWTPVNGTNKNQWAIGEATAMKGTKSAYISTDNGVTAGVSNNAGVSGFYKDFTLPVGDYEITFDWKSKGGLYDTLMVCWVDDDPAFDVTATSSEYFSMDAYFYQKLALAGSTSWQRAAFNIRVRGAESTCKLVFFFGKKTKGGNTNVDPGACIDNVQIGRRDLCAGPTNIKVETHLNDLELSWNGSADKYELMYKDVRSGDNWIEEKDIQGTVHSIPYPEEGLYTFWLRGICGNDTSVWSAYQYVIVTEAAQNCINYIDLHSEAIHTYAGDYGNPWANDTVIDNGEENWNSRHTVNILPDRYDEYTNFQLKTIPDGELASIRLGNPKKGAQAESIIYDYVVDSASTILLMKYAVVLENAHIGTPSDQSRFRLEILYNDKVISDCAKIDFVPEDVQDWEQCKVIDSGGDDHLVLWKDWTDIGVDLSQYANEKIQIRLTTYDCKQKEHFGYAYFTLNCVPKLITGQTCGETPDSISAPAGFNYEWYHAVDMTDVLSTKQTLKINPDDTCTYICKVISPEKPNCSFEMKTVVAPRFPKAEAGITLVQEDCQNWVQFENLSYIYTVNGKIDEPVHSFYWDFGTLGESEEMNPLIRFDQPGQYPVKLYAAMNDGKCDDLWEGTVDIPVIGNVFDTLEVVICEGSYHMHDNKVLTTEGFHDFKYKTSAGCDSLFVIDLKFAEMFNELVNDTICSGESREFFGEMYTETDTYIKKFKSVVTGCDSIYTLNLKVLPEIVFDLTVQPALEGNDGKITINSYPEDFVYYTLNGEQNAPLENLSAGEYELTMFVQEGSVICEKTELVNVAATCLVLSVDEGTYAACADDSEIQIPYTLIAGSVKQYDIAFDDTAIKTAGFENMQGVTVTEENTFVIPFPQVEAPDYVRPGTYMANITFPNQPCDTLITIPFSIYYPSFIVSQRWGDVLFLQNAQYNGGYSFSSYQWYKDEELLEGATDSYLFVSEGLDLNAEYSVEVTRADDGVAAFTCPVVPYPVESVTLTLKSNVVPEGGEVQMTSEHSGVATIYDVSGVQLSRQVVEQGITQLQAPSKAGYYLLKVELENLQVKTYHLQVVK